MALANNVTIYGKKPVNPAKNIIIEKSNKVIGMRYPLSSDSNRGYFVKSVGIPLLRSNLSQLIKTQRGERFMRPNYGCNVKEFLMEPLDEITFEELKNVIYTSISTYFSEITIDKLVINENDELSGMNIDLYCTLNTEDAAGIKISITV